MGIICRDHEECPCDWCVAFYSGSGGADTMSYCELLRRASYVNVEGRRLSITIIQSTFTRVKINCLYQCNLWVFNHIEYSPCCIKCPYSTICNRNFMCSSCWGILIEMIACYWGGGGRCVVQLVRQFATRQKVEGSIPSVFKWIILYL
jgi:hypothetical protein